MMNLEKAVEHCNNFVDKLDKSPEKLLEPNENLFSNIKSNLKTLYDYSKNREVKATKSESLPELIIQNFDNEQIWQQIELQNDCVLANSILSVGNLIAKKDSLKFRNDDEVINKVTQSDEESDKDNESSIGENEAMDDNSGEDESEDEEMDMNDASEEDLVHLKTQKSHKGSIVDDEFFKLHEMEDFLKAEEKKTNKDSGNENSDSDNESEESIDLFGEDLDESEDSKARLAKYKEFFVQAEEIKKHKRNKFLDEFTDDEDIENDQSTFELRQKRLREKISEIEDNAVSEKPWQLQGEIKADSRPQNSLLEEIVEFDRTSRPAPIITGQTTLQLEDIIKQRIRDKVFDSVERKVKPVENLLEYKKKLVLDQEKSKASLAQIYEKEFLDQQAALDPDNAEKEEEPELHKDIRSMMATLFHQLDALSNFHYTPKPAIPELKVISNLPAINMEEVAPVAASDAALLAPEEVKPKIRSNILGESEKTKTDKKRERRKKKLKQKHHAMEKSKRESLTQNAGITKKYSKTKDKQLLDRVTKNSNTQKMDESSGRKGIKSSTTFFTQLQEQVQSHIKDKSAEKKKKTKVVHNAMKLKL